MVKNVMFDFGGVLCRWDRHYVLSQFFAEEDIPVVEPPLFERWLEMDAGTMEYEDYMREVTPRITERLRPQAGRFFQDWYYAMTPIEDMWVLVARLLARRVPLYLLSNGSKPYARRLHELCPLLDCFEAELVSADVRMMKPHADIYELAAREFGIDPAETVCIDAVQETVDGAIACGYRALHYTGDAAALLVELESLMAPGD